MVASQSSSHDRAIVGSHFETTYLQISIHYWSMLGDETKLEERRVDLREVVSPQSAGMYEYRQCVLGEKLDDFRDRVASRNTIQVETARTSSYLYIE